jgi:hypothetical protein
MRQCSTIAPAVSRRARSIVLLIVAAALSGGLAACRRGESSPPVATVAFTSSQTRVPLGSPVMFTYRFDVAPGAAISGDYRVFVHVKTPDGQILWNDDHDLPVPTSQWMAGQTLHYTRLRFVPVDPAYVGEARVEMGLYRVGEDARLVLSGAEPAERGGASRAYLVGTLQLQPPSENIFVSWKTGWHPMEFAPEDASRSWQWTERSAVLSFRNPRSDVTLYLQYAARADLFGAAPQQVTIASAGQPVARLTADSSLVALRRVPITAAQLGPNDWAEVRIDVDRTFVPSQLPAGGRDDRELGLQVYQAFIERR